VEEERTHVARAELSATETESVTTRTDGAWTSSIWQSVTSPDPADTW
jgi:hypothetical protein